MGARETLFEVAITKHRKDAVNFGISTAFSVIGVFLLGGAESSIAHWLSFLTAIGALICFGRYAGESKDASMLERSLLTARSAVLISAPSAEDEALLRSYGRVLERFSGDLVAPLSKLPASKHRLRSIIASALKQKNGGEAEALRTGYLMLSNFQPLLEGHHDLAVNASMQELSELQADFALQ